MNIFMWMLVTLAWWAGIYYSKSFEKWFGRWGWAEQYLGWTAQWYVIVWFVLMVLWLLMIFWVVDLAK